MDRHEAMLRELNLYPMWVRREPVAQDVISETCQQEENVNALTAPVLDESAPVADPVGFHSVNEQVSVSDGIQSSAAITPAADLFEAGPPARRPPVPAVATEDSLREFQLQNQGGALGRLNWSELKQKIRDCELCKLRAGCTQTVAGCGNEQADWMFIGEAPGVDEDATGEPFVGHAGRLLDNMLLAIGLKRAEVYIANVIKCRPPEDRHPHVGEIADCLPYLKRQIDLVQPKVIVALGKTAASALLETDATIGSLRGTVHNYKGIPLIATFHPAYLLRSPMEKAKAWQDLCLAVETMQTPIIEN